MLETKFVELKKIISKNDFLDEIQSRRCKKILYLGKHQKLYADGTSVGTNGREKTRRIFTDRMTFFLDERRLSKNFSLVR